MDPILFYNTRGPYGSFSNFSRDTVTVFGRTWRTSEAAFQAMKFHPHRPDLVRRIFHAEQPSEAAAIGRDRSYPLHPKWESHISDLIPAGSETMGLFSREVDDGRGLDADVAVRLYKDAVMYLTVLAKFSQDVALTKVLVDTGEAPIIEDTTKSGDSYWGWGTDHKGQNRLGKVLMAVRSVLKSPRSDVLEIGWEIARHLGLDGEQMRLSQPRDSSSSVPFSPR